MIKSLKISNFQSHEQTNLEFSPGVNVIVGSSDSGKTAILRALHWLSRNRPSGDSIRSVWGGPTNVILETEEGTVRRVKDKTDQYELLMQGKRSLVFKAFGTNVPQEIDTFLNVNEINVQRQLDAPFLLSETSGAVAQHFNKIANLEQIDTGLQNVNSAIRSLEQTIKYKEGDVKAKEESLQTFAHLDKFEAEVEVLEQLESDLHQKETALQRIKRIISDYNITSEEIYKYDDLLAVEDLVNEILENIDKRLELYNEGIQLNKLISRIQSTKDQIESQQQLIALEPDVINLTALIEQRDALQENHTNLLVDIRDIMDTASEWKKSTELQESLQKRFDKEFPDRCPLCGKPK